MFIPANLTVPAIFHALSHTTSVYLQYVINFSISVRMCLWRSIVQQAVAASSRLYKLLRVTTRGKSYENARKTERKNQ